MEVLSWLINILAVIGWIVNIKNRKRAMIVFALATILSLVYFSVTAQIPFLLRSIFYFGIDLVTLWHIAKRENMNS